MLRCNEVTRLCASDEVRSARWTTRLAVRAHLMMCRHCRRYVRELARIAAAARSLARETTGDDESREALIRRVLSQAPRPPEE